MTETVDKVTDKLLASIQKSQNNSQADQPKKTEAPAKATPKAKTKPAPVGKKAAEAVAISQSIESPRRFVGNLRWPD